MQPFLKSVQGALLLGAIMLAPAFLFPSPLGWADKINAISIGAGVLSTVFLAIYWINVLELIARLSKNRQFRKIDGPELFRNVQHRIVSVDCNVDAAADRVLNALANAGKYAVSRLDLNHGAIECSKVGVVCRMRDLSVRITECGSGTSKVELVSRATTKLMQYVADVPCFGLPELISLESEILHPSKTASPEAMNRMLKRPPIPRPPFFVTLVAFVWSAGVLMAWAQSYPSVSSLVSTAEMDQRNASFELALKESIQAIELARKTKGISKEELATALRTHSDIILQAITTKAAADIDKLENCATDGVNKNQIELAQKELTEAASLDLETADSLSDRALAAAMLGDSVSAAQYVKDADGVTTEGDTTNAELAQCLVSHRAGDDFSAYEYIKDEYIYNQANLNRAKLRLSLLDKLKDKHPALEAVAKTLRADIISNSTSAGIYKDKYDYSRPRPTDDKNASPVGPLLAFISCFIWLPFCLGIKLNDFGMLKEKDVFKLVEPTGVIAEQPASEPVPAAGPKAITAQPEGREVISDIELFDRQLMNC